MKSSSNVPITIMVTDTMYIIDNQHYSKVTFSLLKFLMHVFNMRKYINSDTIIITFHLVLPSRDEIETLKYYENSQSKIIHCFTLSPVSLEVQ